MTEADRQRWDAKHAAVSADAVQLASTFASFEHEFPTSGTALEVACGRGSTAVWLAQRGLTVVAVDVSPVAIDAARALAIDAGVAGRVRFAVADLDDGLPAGPPVSVIVCHLFRDPGIDEAMIRRLVPGGLLAMACLSEVGAEPGPFRARAGELRQRFAALETIAAGEADGKAWLLSRRSGGSTPTSAST